MKYYAYTIGLCASLGGLLLVCTGLYSEDMSKADALGLCFVFIMMSIFFLHELTQIENDE
jgi:hypothetical protein